MSVAHKAPILNLKAVVRETGIKPDTLRAWERRYGLPRPQRAPSGRRLYSRQDVETIHWLVARQAEGMTIGQAVALWRSLEEAGKDPLKEPASLSFVSPPQADGSLEQFRSAWIAACSAFHESAAEGIVAEALALYSPEVVCSEILRQGVAEIGDAWYRGEATVHQEHFASHLIARRIQAMLLAAPSPSRPGHLLILCPPEEQHSLGLLFLTLFLRRAGWETVYLGADLPLENLDSTIRTVRPSMVISGAEQLPAVVGLQSLTLALQELGVPMAFGGRILNLLPSLRNRVPACFLGERLEDAPSRIEELLASPVPPPPSPPISEEYRQALARYRAVENSLHMRVLFLLETRPPDRRPPSWIPEYTFRHVVAALILGDLSFAGQYIDWLWGWRNPGAPPERWLPDFLGSYCDQASHFLGDGGAILVQWLGQQMKIQLTGGDP